MLLLSVLVVSLSVVYFLYRKWVSTADLLENSAKTFDAEIIKLRTKLSELEASQNQTTISKQDIERKSSKEKADSERKIGELVSDIKKQDWHSRSLDQQLSASQQEVATLKKELQVAKRSGMDLNTKMENLELQYKFNLNTELELFKAKEGLEFEELKVSYKDLTDKHSKLSETIGGVVKKNQKNELEIQQLNEAISKKVEEEKWLIKELESIQGDGADEEETNGDCSSVVERAVSIASSISRKSLDSGIAVQDRINELESVIEEQEDSLNELEEDLKDLNHKYELSQQEVQNGSKLSHQLEAKIKSLESTIEKKDGDINQLESQIKELGSESQNEVEITNLKNELLASREETSALQEKSTAHKIELDRLLEKESIVEKEKADLKFKVNEQLESLDALKKQVADLEDSVKGKEISSSVNPQIYELEQKVATLESELSTEKKNVASLQTVLSDSKHEAEALENQVESLTSDIDSEKIKSTKLSEELNDLQETANKTASSETERVNSEISTLKTQITDLEKQVEDSESKIEDLEKQLRVSKAEVSQIENGFKDSQSSLEKQLTEAKKGVTQLEEQVKGSTAEVTQLNEQLENSKVQVAELEKLLRESKAEIKDIESQLKDSRAEIEDREAIIQKQRQVIATNLNTLKANRSRDATPLSSPLKPSNKAES
ncbi:hypothetical protein CLIB1423_13S03774 [[Candida] railenensis]|uniref:Uncharacterized protein n=1 Tax=[Candida] railenensis TaxID=45579 RepID=A0A9P0QS72_9ASCO|nr:hypothetical protein CLIB1423_13S03774 [[Candida] railenensis]